MPNAKYLTFGTLDTSALMLEFILFKCILVFIYLFFFKCILGVELLNAT